MTFDEAVDFVLRNEYGYFGHPFDSERENNFGVSNWAFEEMSQGIIGSDISPGDVD